LFAQTPVIPAPSGPFIILSSVESTNNYAMAKLHEIMLEPGTSFMAVEQTAGRGQRGKTWHAKPGQNITMSTVYPVAASFSGEHVLTYPFVISAVAALACYDFIKAFKIPEIFIKWPNDVYISDRKAAGILIENVYSGSKLQWTVIGTGININQTDFTSPELKAGSIGAATGLKLNVREQALRFKNLLSKRFSSLQSTTSLQIMEEYNDLLYKKDQEVRLKKENIVFTSTIVDVSADGQLNTKDRVERTFRVGEVEFI
jgi:BirA family biotin operon repressor/biotin-[acetyl-CoA-carboxylase] ligase